MRLSPTLFFLIALAPTIVGCSSPLTQKTVSAPLAGDQLFPDGEYRHAIRLTVTPRGGGPGQEFSFEGVVSLHPDRIRVIALSPFGTTTFRLEEDRKTGEIHSEIFVDSMKRFESKLRDYYAVLRLMLVARASEVPGSRLKWEQRDASGRALVASVTGDGPGAGTVFRFLKYDAHGIPEVLSIENPSFKVHVGVTGYAL